MIQRIQSIFLLLASGSFFSQFAFDFAYSDKSLPGLLSDKVYDILDSPILIVLAVLGGIIGLVNIFMFRNRALQLKLGNLLIVLCILLPLVAFLLIYREGVAIAEGTDVNDGFGIYLPLIGIIMAVLANRFIKKDDKLVKSMDRLR